MTRKTISLPTFERLHEVLSYEPETGFLYWKTRPNEDFAGRKYPAERLATSWNNKNANHRALIALDPNGYYCGLIDRIHYKASRVIWKMNTGEEPDTIDHIDGCRTNNTWKNLRNGSSLQNQRNLKIFITNTSGHTGVRWDNQRERWSAYIGVLTKTVFLGYFVTKAEAMAARIAAERLHNFDPTHGRR